jgi:alkaline phosphatase D
MAPAAMMVATCALFAVLAAVGAAAQRSGNMAYLAAVPTLPHLAKPEPAEVHLLHGRALGQTGRKYRDPAKSAWEPRTTKASDAVFAQGVASGDPFAKSVILWARVTPPSGAGKKKPAFLDYCVSKDRSFKECVTRGTTITDAAVDWVAKVEARKLKPNTKYFYQWRYRQNDKTKPVYSPIGRTTTLPRADDASFKRLRLAYFSCSNFPVGFFTSYGQIARMAQRNEIDILVHTGDYIYEYNQTGSSFITDPVLRASRTHQPEREMVSLSDYRTRYNQYNSDVDTRAMRASAPLIPVWDDHEFTNDNWKDGAQNHQPATEGDWAERELRALQAYYEALPIRQGNPDNKLQIFRSFEFGKLMKLIMLDTRVIGRDQQNYTARADPNRSILGANQKAYFKAQLSQAQSSGQVWKIVGQQVLFARNCAYGAASFFSDMWEGYYADQDEMMGFLESNRISNFVVLTGDIHAHWAWELPRYPCKAEAKYSGYNETGQGSLGVEFVSSSITSGYSPVRPSPTESFQQTLDLWGGGAKGLNPHNKYLERFYKGFAVLDIRPKHVTSSWYYAPDLSRPGQYNTMVQGETWRVNAGTNKLVKID